MDLRDPEILRSLIESLRTGVYVIDREGKIALWSDGAEQITGHLRHEVVGRACQEVLMDCDQEGSIICHDLCPLKDSMHDGKVHVKRVYLRHKAGHRLPVIVHAVPIRDAHGMIIGAAESLDKRQSTPNEEARQDTLAAVGCLDVPTGFPHRALTQTHLRESLALFKEHHLPFAILCVRVNDLESFRRLHSRDAADAALRAVGRTIRNTLRPTDFLGRWDEEQFLVVLANCPMVMVERVAERIVGVASSAAIQWWGDWLPIQVSVGHAAVESGDTPESLVARAQTSLAYPVKPQAARAAAGAGSSNKSGN